MFRQCLGFVLLFAPVWTDLNGCELAQASPPTNNYGALMFALFPLGRPAHAPVEVERLVLDGSVLKFDEPLALPSDWPAHLSIRLRNISTKPITYVRVQFSFPESGLRDTPPFGYQGYLGNLIPAQTFNQRGEFVTRTQIVPIVWLPNAEITIPLLDVTGTLAAAERLHKPITRVEVLGVVVQFNDVSTWNGSYFHCQQDGSHCAQASYEEFVQH